MVSWRVARDINSSKISWTNFHRRRTSVTVTPRRRQVPYSATFTLVRPCSRSQFYPTREPFANGTRRFARVLTASTASGSSGTLRPQQEVFAVDANGTRWVGLQCECSSGRVGRVGYGSDAPSAHVCILTYDYPL